MDDLNNKLEDAALNGSLDDFLMALKSESDVKTSNKEQKKEVDPLSLHKEKINMQLLGAVSNNENDRVKELLNQGADSNAKYNGDDTALMIASRNGNLEIVKSLIDNGANVDAKDEYRNTPLIYASKSGHNEVVETLIENKANVHSINNNGETALMKASINGNNEVVNTLIKNKATINERDYDGNTSIMVAAYNGHSEVVKNLLLNHEAEVTHEDSIKLNKQGATFTLDLIDKRDFEKSLHKEIKPIQEQTKKKSLSMSM